MNGRLHDEWEYGEDLRKRMREDMSGSPSVVLHREDLKHLLAAGARARAHGLTEIDNPLYRPERMPAATGEPLAAWNEKASAWRAGWLAENAIRG